jgi:YD repeat-containing protein
MSNIKNTITTNIKPNAKGEITGEILQGVLVDMVDDYNDVVTSDVAVEADVRKASEEALKSELQSNIDTEAKARQTTDAELADGIRDTKENIATHATELDRINETLGPYSDRADIVLSAKETGYVINTDGVKTAKSGWAMAEFSAEKGVEYLFKPGTIDGSVCIFAQKVTTKATRAIDYTYTYDDEGRVKTATATYNGVTYVYNYTYDEETGAQTITDAGGNVVASLPYQYETTVGTYLPMTRLNAGAELPQDGYCRLMSHFQGNASLTVVVSYKVGSADLTMKVVKDGVFASVATQLGNLSGNISSTQSALDSNDHQTAENEADIEGILATYGNNDSRDIRLLCGQPEVLYGEGTPQESIVPKNWKQFDPETGEGYNWTGLPSALGQMYVNTTATSNPAYISVRGGEYELKWLNI